MNPIFSHDLLIGTIFSFLPPVRSYWCNAASTCKKWASIARSRLPSTRIVDTIEWPAFKNFGYPGATAMCATKEGDIFTITDFPFHSGDEEQQIVRSSLKQPEGVCIYRSNFRIMQVASSRNGIIVAQADDKSRQILQMDRGGENKRVVFTDTLHKNYINGLTEDKNGSIYFSSARGNVIKIITPNGEATDFGDEKTTEWPQFMSADDLGNVYFISRSSVKMITPDRKVHTLVGSKLPAEFDSESWEPRAICCSPEGGVYVGDTWRYRILFIHPTTRRVSVYAGAGEGEQGYGQGKQQPLEATFSLISHLALDSSGKLYVFTSASSASVACILDIIYPGVIWENEKKSKRGEDESGTSDEEPKHKRKKEKKAEKKERKEKKQKKEKKSKETKERG